MSSSKLAFNNCSVVRNEEKLNFSLQSIFTSHGRYRVTLWHSAQCLLRNVTLSTTALTGGNISESVHNRESASSLHDVTMKYFLTPVARAVTLSTLSPYILLTPLTHSRGSRWFALTVVLERLDSTSGQQSSYREHTASHWHGSHL